MPFKRRDGLIKKRFSVHAPFIDISACINQTNYLSYVSFVHSLSQGRVLFSHHIGVLSVLRTPNRAIKIKGVNLF
jgi:hypothetical protein